MCAARYNAGARVGDQGYPAWELSQILRAIKRLYGEAVQTELCSRLGVLYELLPSQAFVPVWQVQGAMAALGELSDNPAIGMIAASDYKVDELGYLKGLLAKCQTLKECFVLLSDHPEWAGSVNDSVVSWTEQGVTVRWLNTARLPPAQFCCHFLHSLGALVVLGRQLCATDFALTHVALQAPVHPAQELAAMCGCKVSFNADFCEWSASHQTLALPVRYAFTQEDMSAGTPEISTFIDEVIRTLKGHMPQLPSLSQLAKELNMSDRTLRRRLASCGCSYQRLLDQLRSQLAIGYIFDGQLSAEDIAGRLGYEDVSHFRASFKHWLGAPPGRFARLIGNCQSRPASYLSNDLSD